MPSLADVAYAHQERVTSVGDAAVVQALRAWRAGMTADFDHAWVHVGPRTVAAVRAGQVAAAGLSAAYVRRVSALQDDAPDGDPDVEPAAWGGVDASGRDVGGLLYGAVAASKAAVGAGAGVQAALQQGAAHLAVMAGTAVTDTARSADMASAVGRRYVQYVRVVQPGACSRCAILAGTRAYGTDVFKRHPRCRCTGMPIGSLDKSPAALHATPDDYFRTLTPEDQDRIFTKAGAEAIRAGADPVAVVTARRGAPGIDYSRAVLNPRTLPNSGRRLERSIIGHRDGQPVFGYTTGEGTTRRGQVAKNQARAGLGFGRRVRLMPETIVGLTRDRELRAVLLRDAGYLRYPNGAAERNALVRADRAAADGFYRSHGISLG